MSRLILIRHAQSVADSVIETMRRDPIYRTFQESLRDELLTETRRTMARELHFKYHLPCSINDAELVPESISQIKTLGRFLETVEVQPQKIWCSPLVRACATLQHLKVIYPILASGTVTFDNRLAERQRGDEAARFADIQIYLALNQSEFLRKMNCPPLGYAPPGGESLQDVQARSVLALQEILTELCYGDTLVVTHHSVICSLRSQLEQWPEDDFLRKLIGDKPPNCGVLVYNAVGGGVKLVHRSW